MSDEFTTFDQLQLSAPIMKALKEVGYETPSPIQAQIIPLVLEGKDVLGQAQTGTGKTAAFALPILSKIDISQKAPQVLVLAPTRELAIQVAEAFQRYACHIKGFHVTPIYGGQDYGGQIRALKRGVHVVVGTPGRVMDHMRRGTLKLNELKVLVLDEADEMLRMGFIDDVEWILEQTPKERQIALFSATIPQQVRRIAKQHLTDQIEITIKVTTTSADLIRQRYWPVSGTHKLDALTRILEAEEFDGMIIFVRTKLSTVDLAEKLTARGFAAAALNGDIAQRQREMTVDKLKKGKLDILVATDVAARGLDVERVSHVVNYDIPYDTEAYIHRIGRTGRAGRKGDAILFVAPRERRLLSAIERATKNKIEVMELPSTESINDKRIAQFKESITEALTAEDLPFYTKLIEQYLQEHDVTAVEIASAVARLAQGDSPLLLKNKTPAPARARKDNDFGSGLEPRPRRKERGSDGDRKSSRENSFERSPKRNRRDDGVAEEGMQRFRLEVGHEDKVMPGNIVGAIANEAGLDAKEIGRINIFDNFSTVDLPEGMPEDVFNDLKKVWVSGRTLNISKFEGFDQKPQSGGHDRDSKEERPNKRPPRENFKSAKPKKKKPKDKKVDKKDAPKSKIRLRDKADQKNIGKRRTKPAKPAE